jgi:Ca2+-binding RTX toxin-like protein
VNGASVSNVLDLAPPVRSVTSAHESDRLGDLPLLGGTGADQRFGGQNSDLINGGPGDDTLVRDLPGPPETGFLPPTPDPTLHFDTCIGAGGTDQAFTCERTIAI